MSTEQAQRRAGGTGQTRWARARERGEALVARVARRERGVFLVPSQREGQPGYEVYVEGHPGHVRCTCPAGLADQPCAHAAAVIFWIKRFNAQVEARRATPVRRCQGCFLTGCSLFESPARRLLCAQCAEGEQREAGARRRRARAA